MKAAAKYHELPRMWDDDADDPGMAIAASSTSEEGSDGDMYNDIPPTSFWITF